MFPYRWTNILLESDNQTTLPTRLQMILLSDHYLSDITKYNKRSLCFEAVGWAAGRATGL